MSKQAMITVAMPVYNREKYLAEAIDSVIAQTFTDWHLLLIDDGSTDRSVEIAKRYIARDDRIRLIEQDHAGCYPARNRALAETKSRYTAVMDSDDVAIPERFEKQLAFLESCEDHVAVGSWITITDPFGVPNRLVELPLEHEAIDGQQILGSPGRIIHGAALYRTAVLYKIGGYRETPTAADYDLFLRLAEIGRLANLPEPLQNVRRHFQSISGSSRARQIDIGRQFMQEARARRGLPPLPEHSVSQRDANVLSVAEQARSWAGHAIHQNELGIARKHAWTVLRSEPWRLDSWRLLRWAICG